MPMVDSDWSIDRATKNIRYIGQDHTFTGSPAPSYATVIEFHRWLQDFADDAVYSGDDELDIIDPTPSDRSTDNIITLQNGYNIDDTAAEHLYDGSIIQYGGNEIYDGIVNFGNTANIQIIQNGAVLADDWWNLPGSPGTGLNADPGAGISHRFMIKVRGGSPAADIDGRRLIGTSRNFGFTYSEFPINGTSRGNNVLALSEAADLNNETALATVATWSDITNLTEGYATIDVDGNATPENYYSEWDRGSRTINQFYERMKWLTREGSASTLYGLSGELFRGITHQVPLSGGSGGPWSAFEAVSWPTGTGQMLAIDNTTATSATTMWIQVLTGVAPTNTQTITGGGSGASNTVNGTATERTITAPFVGQSTGSAIIGSYGLGIQATDLTASDKLFDLTNTQRVPPNNVTFTVSGLVAGEDRVLVGPEDGAGGLDYDQLSLAVTLSGAGETSVVITETIPLDTPSTGTIRIQNDEGLYRRVSYTSYSGNTFTIPSTDFSGTGEQDSATGGSPGNNVFISYIDELATGSPAEASFTGVYQSDRTLFIRVRDGGVTPIKTFETTGTLGSAGGSSTAIRTSDS